MSDLQTQVTQQPINPEGYTSTTIFNAATQQNEVVFTAIATTGTIDALGGVNVAQLPALSLGHYVKMTLDANIQITLPTDSISEDDLAFELTQDVVGSRLVTWVGAKFTGGTAPTLTATANAMDVIKFKWNGLAWLCIGTFLNLH
jgi:hypothetical protein